MSKLSTESYKGVRDFYPEDKFIQNYIFGVMRSTVESFGYSEYDASILEPAELYKAKSGEEIVNEQTYTFTDRGEREVTLRPEMTPTVARMVAARSRELTFPLRWYSIPNLFRYEKPQRGRLREHWQLNVDLFGATGVSADAEVITVAYMVMKNLGAKDDDFTIKLNSRKLLQDLFAIFALDAEQSQRVTKLLDKKEKLDPSDFTTGITEVIGDKAEKFVALVSSNENLLEQLTDKDSAKDLINLIEILSAQGVKNVEFVPSITRGFDYYTGMVFEVFDTNPENSRALFGGGRYDDLLDMFGVDKVPTVGFGMGDVTATDFLAVRNLLPTYHSPAELYICVLKSDYVSNATALAHALRAEHVNVSIDLSGKKVGDQIKIADKQKIPYILVIGEDEIKTDMYTLKNLETGVEEKLDIAGIVAKLKK